MNYQGFVPIDRSTLRCDRIVPKGKCRNFARWKRKGLSKNFYYYFCDMHKRIIERGR